MRQLVKLLLILVFSAIVSFSQELPDYYKNLSAAQQYQEARQMAYGYNNKISVSLFIELAKNNAQIAIDDLPGPLEKMLGELRQQRFNYSAHLNALNEAIKNRASLEDTLIAAYAGGKRPQFQKALELAYHYRFMDVRKVTVRETAPAKKGHKRSKVKTVPKIARVEWHGSLIDLRAIRNLAIAMGKKQDEIQASRQIAEDLGDENNDTKDWQEAHKLFNEYGLKEEARKFAWKWAMADLDAFGLGNLYCNGVDPCGIIRKAGQDDDWKDAMMWLGLSGRPESEFRSAVQKFAPKVYKSADENDSGLKAHAAQVLYKYLGDEQKALRMGLLADSKKSVK